MAQSLFLLSASDNLTYDAAAPNFCTDEPNICYLVKAPVPAGVGTQSTLGGGPGWMPVTKTYECETEDEWDKRHMLRYLQSKGVRRRNLDFAKTSGINLFRDAEQVADAVRTKERKEAASQVDRLRGKLKKYKAEVRKLNEKLASKGSSVEKQLEELRSTVQRLEGVVQELRTALHSKPLPVRRRTKPVETPAAAPETEDHILDAARLVGELETGIAAAMAKGTPVERRRVSLVEDPAGAVVRRLSWAALIYLATEALVSPDERWLGLVGRGAAATLFVSAVARMLGVPEPKGK